VVGTILLLALTVTLFSSIFFFVSTFPSPAPQPANQFSASLTYNKAATQIIGVNILHLAGPGVPGNSLVYLFSSAHPTRFPTPFTVSSGINNSPVWNLGQTWTANITSSVITAPDNITISVVTSTQLLFRVTLPGNTPAVPPTFTTVGTSPTSPGISQAFQVYVAISDLNLNLNSVYLNLSLVPGISGTGLQKMSFSATTGLWSYTVPGGTTSTAGTFYLFVNATDLSGLKNSVAFTVTIVASSTIVTASLIANNTAPVSNQPVRLSTLVTTGGSGIVAAVAVFANGASIGSGGGFVGAGSTSTFQVTWTPSTAGVYLLTSLVNSSGAIVAGATLNITVFPPILFVAHNVPGGVRTANNESAYLAEELTSDGIPFTPMWVPCATLLPASSTFTAYKVVIIDYGSTWIGGCPKSPSASEQAKLTGATGVSFLVVGANAFGSPACGSYTSAYLGLFGVKWLSGGTCVTLPNATATLTYTSAPALGLRADGIPSSMTANKTLGSSSSFVPYTYFQQGTLGTAFLKAGANVVASIPASGTRGAGIAMDPALLAGILPNGNNWGTGEAGSSVIYNVMNYLCGLATSTSTGRALTDFGIGQATVLGVNHAKLTVVYVALRANGPVSGVVTATLYVNGSTALYQGTIVAQSVTVAGLGTYQFVTLTWVAPANGPFTLSVVLTTTAGDLYLPNNQLPLTVLNQATTFA